MSRPGPACRWWARRCWWSAALPFTSCAPATRSGA